MMPWKEGFVTDNLGYIRKYDSTSFAVPGITGIFRENDCYQYFFLWGYTLKR